MKHDKVLLGHGSGGKLSHDLIDNLFVKYFSNSVLSQQTDSAILSVGSEKLAFTTDSFVVDPVFFPGGNIGKLAVAGTVNDLAVSGAKPMYISSSFIIEEGFSFSELEEIVKAMAEEANKAGVKIVTGDTKVVHKGAADKVFINTSGIGFLEENNEEISSGKNIKTGDKILINGSIGDHGMAIMSARNDIKIFNNLVSDCACLNQMIDKLLSENINTKFMRDATRGGVATVLSELAKDKSYGVEILEEQVPVKDEVRGMCELLGFDPFYVANEGKIVLVVAEEDAEKAVELLKLSEFGEEAAIIGEISEKHKSLAWVKTSIGGSRILDMLAGEQLPRIC